MNKYRPVRFECKDEKNKTIEYDFLLVDSSYSIFFNAQHKLLVLNAKQRCFFDYLCEKMKEDNRIYMHQAFKREFIDHFNNVRGKAKPVKEADIEQYITLLNKLGLILKYNAWTCYKVNPKYVFKGSSKMRMECLVDLIKHYTSKGESVADLIPIPEDQIRYLELSEQESA